MRRAAPYRPSPWLTRISALAVRALGRLYAPVQVSGRERRPAGPYVAVFNHGSALDVAALAHLVDRPVCFWAKAELRGKPLLGAWLSACGAVFVRRGQRDTGAFEEALDRLRAGLPFFLAPEGTRHHGEEGVRPRTGFVRLAQLGGIPVLPCAIAGARAGLPPGHVWPRLRGRSPVHVQVGEPLRLPPLPVDEAHRAELADQAASIMDIVYRMKAELEERG
ncbi:MAG: lysophospholipid acyltransferase family protein [bacterium]|jgi:1-acyl-sn-glycerol-3-phosphate acyltransferase|nr:lysophospholipid acyltransferase family protein [bacterium]